MLLLFCLSKGYSQENRWIFLGNTDGTEIYLDNQTIFYNNISNSYKVYLKITSIDNSYQMQLAYFYCDRRTMKIVNTTFFDKYGNFINTLEDNFNSNIIPDSNPEKVFNHLCK